MRNNIPTFRPNGTPGRDYSPEAIVKLEAAGRVLVERDASGFIEAAQFLPKPDPKPTQRNTIPTGTYYSYEELIEAAGHYAWTHKDLVEEAGKLVGKEREEVEDFLKGVFRATALSCLTGPIALHSGAAKLAHALSVGPEKHKKQVQLTREERKRRKAEARRQARLQRKRLKK